MIDDPSRNPLTLFAQGSFSEHPHLTQPMQKLVQQAAQKLLATYTSPQWQEVFKIKTASLFLLNNSSNFAKSWMHLYDFSSSCVSSIDMIHLVEEIANDSHLTDATKECLLRWLSSEKRYLPYAVALDALRFNSITSTLLSSDRPLIKQGSTAIASVLAQAFPIDEAHLNTLAEQMHSQVQSYPPGSSADKFLIGTPLHEVRLRLNRQEDGNFKLIYFEPNIQQARQWENITPEILSKEFWYDLILAKLRGYPPLSEVFEKHFKQEGELCQNKAEMKKIQVSNSCPMHTLVRDLKYEIITAAPSEEEGVLQYKKVKALIASTIEKKQIGHPLLKEFISWRAAEKNLYFHWEQCAQGSDGLQLYQGYSTALHAFNLKQPLKSYPDGIVDKVQTLRDLDQALGEKLKGQSLENIEAFVSHYFPPSLASKVCLKLRHYKAREQAVVFQALNEIHKASYTRRVDSFLRKKVVQAKEGLVGKLPSSIQSIALSALDEAWLTLSVGFASREEMERNFEDWVIDHMEDPAAVKERIEELYQHGFFDEERYKHYIMLTNALHKGEDTDISQWAFTSFYLIDIVSRNKKVFRFFPENLKNDETFIWGILKHNPAIYTELPLERQNDVAFARMCAKKNLRTLPYLPDELKNDVTFLKSVFTPQLIKAYISDSSKPELVPYLQNLPEELKKDNQFILDLFGLAANANIPLTEKATERWQQILKFAPQLFPLLPEHLQQNPALFSIDNNFILKVIHDEPFLYRQLPPELKKDAALTLSCLMISLDIFLVIPRHFLNDANYMKAVFHPKRIEDYLSSGVGYVFSDLMRIPDAIKNDPQFTLDLFGQAAKDAKYPLSEEATERWKEVLLFAPHLLPLLPKEIQQVMQAELQGGQ